jgi:hypothetical protein
MRAASAAMLAARLRYWWGLRRRPAAGSSRQTPGSR